MRWAEPLAFILLVLVPLPAVLERWRGRIAWPTLGGFEARGWQAFRARWLARLPGLMRGLAIACLVAALARPQTVAGRTRRAAQGVAIVAVLDHSSSMTARDDAAAGAAVARLEAARRALARFVAGRPDDLIGLVAFANYPDLLCPPTLDHDFLVDTLNSVRPARPGDDGTNLGDAVVWAVEALKGTTPRAKVVVLLTDGRNSPATPNPTDPIEAARIARGLGVKLHTVAVGQGGALLRAVEPRTGLGVTTEIEGPDLPLLKQMADEGEGQAFVATDANALERVLDAIDALEKSPVQGTVRMRYREWFPVWLAAGLGLVVADRWLAAGRLRRLP